MFRALQLSAIVWHIEPEIPFGSGYFAKFCHALSLDHLKINMHKTPFGADLQGKTAGEPRQRLSYRQQVDAPANFMNINNGANLVANRQIRPVEWKRFPFIGARLDNV